MALFRPKIADKDFEESALPSTRKAVFFDVLRQQWFSIVVCGLLLSAGAIPFVLTDLLDYHFILTTNASVNAGTISEAQAAVSISMMTVILSAVDILGCVIFGLCLSMATCLIKLLAWEEPTRILKAFKTGIKQNGKQYFCLSLLLGCFMFACRYAITAGFGSFLAYITVIVCLLIPAPVAAYMLVTINVYDIKFTQQCRYSLIVFNKRKLKTFLAYLIGLIPFAVMVVSDLFFPLADSVIMKSVMFFLLSFFLLGWFLFAFNSLDEAINKKFYPQLVGRGLRLAEYEDDSSWMNY